MFCRCGTLIHLPVIASEEARCGRCAAVVADLRPVVAVATREFSERVEHEHSHARGAKIKMRCPLCGCDELTYNTAQLRSADEGQTVFYTCECGFKETVNS